MNKYETIINTYWSQKENNQQPDTTTLAAIEDAIIKLDKGELTVSRKVSETSNHHGWITHSWIKKAILLYKSQRSNRIVTGGSGETNWWYNGESKFDGWNENSFVNQASRVVPNCLVRKSAFLGENSIIMPSYIGEGAYIGAGTTVDTWCNVGACAHIGSNVHLSGGVGIGSTLEPIEQTATIIEDDCFIGARSEIGCGVVIGRGAVISMGVLLNPYTPIIDRDTGHTYYGYVPPYSVVVSGSHSSGSSEIANYCAVIIKTVDAKTKSKTGLNDLLRD